MILGSQGIITLILSKEPWRNPTLTESRRLYREVKTDTENTTRTFCDHTLANIKRIDHNKNNNMVSLREQAFSSMFTVHHDTDECGRYPEPAHSTGSYDTNITSPVAINNMYSVPSTMGFEPSLYAEASHYGYNNGNASPCMYQDDELRVPSSSLSTNSAASSVVASPQSNPSHQMPAAPEWNPHSMHPGIVGNDYITNPAEYTRYPGQGMEELTFDFAHNTKDFVGKLPSDASMSYDDSRVAGSKPESAVSHHHRAASTTGCASDTSLSSPVTNSALFPIAPFARVPAQTISLFVMQDPRD